MDETDKKEVLKSIIRRLHEGADPEEVKEEFKDVLKGTESFDIAQIEQQLIEEGMPIDEIRRLCDVHFALFRESLEEEKVEVPEGHPIHILVEEHGIILGFAEELRNLSKMVKEAEDFDSAKENLEQLKRIAENFRESESHYVREENVLFPVIEKHGVTKPPAVMWMEHDTIREMEKNLYKLLDNPRETSFRVFAKKLGDAALSLAEMLSTHFYKENNILYPTALKIIPENEWKDIRHEFDELGYCGFTPKPPEVTIEAEKPAPTSAEGVITFETGTLTVEEMESVLNTLPVDITFVDKNDEVRYFSKSKERIFPRTKAVIGRKVQQCHPQKSVHVVNQILEDFKSGRRDVAEFWINLDNRLIHIRYFPVRSKNGDYLGTLEVTQDITDIKKIQGEKRLL
ncbi:MAG: DUF438 domain-containing protein [Candidatus Freyrarchaeum guaymaensis]